MPKSAVGDLARRNQFSTRRDHAAHCFSFLLFPLPLARGWASDALDDSGKKGGRREEILRSERNGVPVMGSPGISLKCRGLSIIRGQPLLHRASRSAGDEVRKERKGGGVRWKRTQACTRRNEHARSPLLLLFLSFLAFRTFFLSGFANSLSRGKKVAHGNTWFQGPRDTAFEVKERSWELWGNREFAPLCPVVVVSIFEHGEIWRNRFVCEVEVTFIGCTNCYCVSFIRKE